MSRNDFGLISATADIDCVADHRVMTHDSGDDDGHGAGDFAETDYATTTTTDTGSSTRAGAITAASPKRLYPA
jgi:hypothetical protein